MPVRGAALDSGTFTGPVDFQTRPDGDGDHYPIYRPIYLVGWINGVPGFDPS